MTVLLTACSSEDSAQAPSSAQSELKTPAIATLPFTIEGAMLSDLFQGHLKVAKVYVNVAGGNTDEWAATAIAIADAVTTYGADSVEVVVNRQDIVTGQSRFREGAHVYFSPNTKRSVWDDGETWKVLRADPARLATQQDVDISEGYYALNQELVNKGRSEDQAGKEAGAVIAKKYHLPKDWHLPTGTAWDETPRASLNVDPAGASESMAILATCLKGKVVRMMTTCND